MSRRHEMARAKRRRARQALCKLSSFGRGLGSLVRLVSGRRRDWEEFDTLDVARICRAQVAYKQIRQRKQTAALSAAETEGSPGLRAGGRRWLRALELMRGSCCAP